MKKFLPLKREKLTRCPWGYEPDQSDPYLLLPIGKQLEALERGFDMLDKGVSFGKVAGYISSESGRSITGVGLCNLYEAAPGREEGRTLRTQLVRNHTDNNRVKARARLTETQRTALGINRIKSRLTKQEKRLKRLREEQATVQVELDKVPVKEKTESKIILPATPIHIPEQAKLVPNPGPQTDFLAAAERCVLYGGAAGGGKSWAIVIDPLRTAHMKAHHAITFRKTNDELRDLIAMSKEIYPLVIPGAKFLEQKSTWQFPNGGTHWYRYLDRDDDVKAMQGQAYTWVGFDELTQWSSPFVFDYMRSRVRTTDPAIRPYLSIRATTNPGNVGHAWVKKFFIDPAPANTAFPVIDVETGQVRVHKRGPNKGKPLFYCRFIPAMLSDNPYLFEDGDYEANLLSLNDVQQKQLLEGNWDIAEGAAFTEFDRTVHTCAPFDIPAHWTRFRAADWGHRAFACCLWFAVDGDGNLYVYRELYAKGKLADEFADMIVQLEAGENIQYGVLDSSCWHQRGDTGPSIAESMIKRGCFWRPADRSPGSRVSSKQEVHRRLHIRELPDEISGEPKRKANLTIFNNCLNIIRTLPTLPIDKNNSEDIDTDSEDHAYDALRYGCASRPIGRIMRPLFNSITARPRKQYNSFGFPT